MSIGSFVRKKLGIFEIPIANAYRAIFVDLEKFVYQIKFWVNSPDNILEVGCGEGAVAACLVKNYLNSHITGIDITPNVGRLFDGDPSKIIFKQQTISDYVSENPSSADLIIIGDVIHHIPVEMRYGFLCDVKKALKSGGYLILKDWKKSNTPIHLLCYLSDTYITGDNVCYKTEEELRSLVMDVFGDKSIKNEAVIPPWKNNIAFLIQV